MTTLSEDRPDVSSLIAEAEGMLEDAEKGEELDEVVALAKNITGAFSCADVCETVEDFLANLAAAHADLTKLLVVVKATSKGLSPEDKELAGEIKATAKSILMELADLKEEMEDDG